MVVVLAPRPYCFFEVVELLLELLDVLVLFKFDRPQLQDLLLQLLNVLLGLVTDALALRESSGEHFVVGLASGRVWIAVLVLQLAQLAE